MTNRARTLLASLLLVAGVFGTARAELPIKPFEARYSVNAKGMEVGLGTIELFDQGQGRYRMEARLGASGLASLLVADEILEQVEGRFDGSTPKPISYRRSQTGGKKEHHGRARFDWDGGKVEIRYDDKQRLHALDTRVVDPLSLYALAMTDLKRGHYAREYTLVNKADIRTYSVMVEGEELLDTPIGRLQTVRVSRQRKGKNRITTLWFAEALDYLPVKITQSKAGSEQLRMTIESVKR